jgi:hypothetical protein
LNPEKPIILKILIQTFFRVIISIKRIKVQPFAPIINPPLAPSEEGKRQFSVAN